jgi:hypothetical protein
MAVDEERLRQSLHNNLAQSVGRDEAALLMHYLPPVGWADVATKRDLDVLRSEMEVLRSDLRVEISDLRGDIKSQTARIVMWLVPTMIAGLAVAGHLG